MKNDNDKLLRDFTYDALVLKPIEKIIFQLETHGNEYSIEELNKRLQVYMETAAITLGLDNMLVQQQESAKPVVMNSYAKEYYLKYFRILLDYFKNTDDE